MTQEKICNLCKKSKHDCYYGADCADFMLEYIAQIKEENEGIRKAQKILTEKKLIVLKALSLACVKLMQLDEGAKYSCKEFIDEAEKILGDDTNE